MYASNCSCGFVSTALAFYAVTTSRVNKLGISVSVPSLQFASLVVWIVDRSCWTGPVSVFLRYLGTLGRPGTGYGSSNGTENYFLILDFNFVLLLADTSDG